jgi:hypothetical protein
MFSLSDFLLGGALPCGAAALAFVLGRAALRQPTAAWSTGVVLGYATGLLALDARGVGLRAALSKLIQPHESHEWTPLIGLIAVAPALVGAALGKWRLGGWLLAAVLCAVTPLWLLWGGKYLPGAETRASGFATDAWFVRDAILILGAVVVATLAVWLSWEKVDSENTTFTRSLLTVAALVGAAAMAVLTGSFVYAQAFGVLAASVGGCLIAALLLRVKAGPEGAAGPVLLIAASLLLLAACYSELHSLQALCLGAALLISAGWIPGLSRLGRGRQIALRTSLCLVPLVAVVAHGGVEFQERQRQQQEDAASNPYLSL